MVTALPTFNELMNPLLRAMQALGGSGSIEEIYDKVLELEGFSEEMLSHLHDPEKSNQTEIGYRLAWARSYLKKAGLLDNSARGVWSLNAKTKDVAKCNHSAVVQSVRALWKKTAKKDKAIVALDNGVVTIPDLADPADTPPEAQE